MCPLGESEISILCLHIHEVLNHEKYLLSKTEKNPGEGRLEPWGFGTENEHRWIS